MGSMMSAEVWKKKTVEFAISARRLIQLMNEPAEVELRSPAPVCPACRKPAEVVVLPDGWCGNCWLRRAIASWRVKQVAG